MCLFAACSRGYSAGFLLQEVGCWIAAVGRSFVCSTGQGFSLQERVGGDTGTARMGWRFTIFRHQVRTGVRLQLAAEGIGRDFCLQERVGRALDCSTGQGFCLQASVGLSCAALGRSFVCSSGQGFFVQHWVGLSSQDGRTGRRHGHDGVGSKGYRAGFCFGLQERGERREGRVGHRRGLRGGRGRLDGVWCFFAACSSGRFFRTGFFVPERVGWGTGGTGAACWACGGGDVARCCTC